MYIIGTQMETIVSMMTSLARDGPGLRESEWLRPELHIALPLLLQGPEGVV